MRSIYPHAGGTRPSPRKGAFLCRILPLLVSSTLALLYNYPSLRRIFAEASTAPPVQRLVSTRMAPHGLSRLLNRRSSRVTGRLTLFSRLRTIVEEGCPEPG